MICQQAGGQQSRTADLNYPNGYSIPQNIRSGRVDWCSGISQWVMSNCMVHHSSFLVVYFSIIFLLITIIFQLFLAQHTFSWLFSLSHWGQGRNKQVAVWLLATEGAVTACTMSSLDVHLYINLFNSDQKPVTDGIFISAVPMTLFPISLKKKSTSPFSSECWRWLLLILVLTTKWESKSQVIIFVP